MKATPEEFAEFLHSVMVICGDGRPKRHSERHAARFAKLAREEREENDGEQ